MRDCIQALVGVAMLLGLFEAHAQELLTTEDGVSLYGTVRLVGRSAATCNVLAERHTAEVYEQTRANHGQPLDIWELEYSVYNGSGRALDHLIAYYQVESPHPPCTNWDEHWEAGDYSLPVDWSGPGGRIQRTGAATPTLPNETITETMLVLAFRDDQPHFSDWSVNYTFLDGGTASAAAPPQASPALPVAPVAETAPDLPSGVSPHTVCEEPWNNECWLGSVEGDCYVWRGHEDGLIDSASGQCSDDGLASGHWIWTYQNGINEPYVHEGPYANGRRHGHWIEEESDGSVDEGPYVNGERHGCWTMRSIITALDLEIMPDDTPYVEGSVRESYSTYFNGDHVGFRDSCQ